MPLVPFNQAIEDSLYAIITDIPLLDWWKDDFTLVPWPLIHIMCVWLHHVCPFLDLHVSFISEAYIAILSFILKLKKWDQKGSRVEGERREKQRRKRKEISVSLPLLFFPSFFQLSPPITKFFNYLNPLVPFPFNQAIEV